MIPTPANLLRELLFLTCACGGRRLTYSASYIASSCAAPVVGTVSDSSHTPPVGHCGRSEANSEAYLADRARLSSSRRANWRTERTQYTAACERTMAPRTFPRSGGSVAAPAPATALRESSSYCSSANRSTPRPPGARTNSPAVP